MEAAIVGALLKATLPSLFKLIGDRCKQLEPDVRFIQSELEFMQAAFGDSRWRGAEISNLRRTWILQLRRLAHEIQDCIDSFQIHKTSATQFAHEIADLKKRIQDSSEGLHRYIGQGEPSNGKVAPNPMANDAEEDLLAFVQNQSEMNAKVICAIGFGGQNTDLARRVYEKDEVCRQFGQRAWVTAVDRTFDDVLTEILRQLEGRPGLGMIILSWLLSILCFFRGLLLKVFGTEMPVASWSSASSGIDYQLRSLLSKERCASNLFYI
uniref:Disease resistance N-terminal domain-containing protein n=1 Tax=Aegilops tauschii subsp. strangulata TaxID=200361 RepID=A0A453GSC1_AEGTS